jgi:hypothetical protein
MKGKRTLRRSLRISLAGLGLIVGAGLTGCQIDQGGQTLPSPYYMQDDVQYYAPGAEFKLAREAAAMKEYNQQQAQMTPQVPQVPPLPQPPIR